MGLLSIPHIERSFFAREISQKHFEFPRKLRRRSRQPLDTEFQRVFPENRPSVFGNGLGCFPAQENGKAAPFRGKKYGN